MIWFIIRFIIFSFIVGQGDPVIFEAHKLMLSVCSSFFRSILTRKSRNQNHPIVFLKDVEPRHMEQLLQYMYRGEINVLQDDLAPLIETARSLQVKSKLELGDNCKSNTFIYAFIGERSGRCSCRHRK